MATKTLSVPNTLLTLRQLAIFWASLALLIASAKIQVPMTPVPVTFQTAVVLALPCFFGLRMALYVITSYLTLGFSGAPVFAIGVSAGPAYFLGHTAGYLTGFVLAASLVGIFYDKNRHNLFILFGIMIAGHVIILILGALWLAFGIPGLGTETAVASGILPFLTGSLLKSGISAAFVKAFRK